jgi:pre-rRNA-processing protein TSR2
MDHNHGQTQAQQSAQSQTPPNPSEISAQLDLGISLILNSWPSLTLAVQSNWGGPESAEKRDWLCGAIADLFVSRPETDAADVEEVLLQVMTDEFDVVVDDGSAGEIADRICELRAEVMSGEFRRVRTLWEDWKAKGGDKGMKNTLFRRVETGEEDQETDGEDEDGEDDEDEDVDMEDAPALSQPPRERIEPEVDDDGFMKVVGRRKR